MNGIKQYRCPQCDNLLGESSEDGVFERIGHGGTVVYGNNVVIKLTCKNSTKESPHPSIMLIKNEKKEWRYVISKDNNFPKYED